MVSSGLTVSSDEPDDEDEDEGVERTMACFTSTTLEYTGGDSQLGGKPGKADALELTRAVCG